MTKPTREKLTKLFIEDNLTAAQIAERLGCGISTVRKWLSEYGIGKITGAEYAARYARFNK